MLKLKMNFCVKHIFLFFLFPLSVYALEIQRDALDAFIFTDHVASLNSEPCQNDILFTPENSSFYGKADTYGIPFRIYTIALPNSNLPSVNLENIKSEKINDKPCGAEQNPTSLRVGKPYLKDNLWRVKIEVPLLYSNGNSWNLRRQFRVRINFNGSANNYSIGKRALSQVENKKAAAKFGAEAMQTGSRTVLKRSVADIDWLLRMEIGTTDLSATADGMYAISFNELRTIAGSAVDGISIDNLILFGASPDTLSEIIGAEIFPNAVEIPILVKDKNENKIFDSGDSIIFFGYGTSLWKKSNSLTGMDYYFSHSPYSYYQSFYLGANKAGERLKSYTTKDIVGAKEITWKKYVRSEKNLLLRDAYFSESVIEHSGKEWFWKWGKANVESSEFQESVRNLTNIKGNSVLIGVTFLPRPQYQYISSNSWKERIRSINFNFQFQGQTLQSVDTIFSGTFVFEGTNASSVNTYRVETLSSDKFSGLSVAYNYDVAKSAGNEWLFPGTASGAVKIPVPAGMELIKTMDFIPVEIIEGVDGYANDTISSSRDIKYFLHRKNSYKKPATIEAIPNRINYVSKPWGISDQTDYLILTSEILQNSALKLKQFRESGEAPIKLSTAVVLVEDIYMVHGAQKNSPVAIRDYIRYAKNRCPKLKYVLLAGAGNYDYRKIRANSRVNLIPPYEAEDTSSDDFFAILDPGEAVRFGKYNLDLAIGRLPVSNPVEFENYVQKVIDYERKPSMNNGIWRNTIIFNSDDQLQGNTIDIILHTKHMEQIALSMDTLAKGQGFAIDQRKISLLQYEKDGNGKKPDATRELLLRLNQGALFTFYYGHGNSVQWADEDLLNMSSLNYINNSGRYTILGSFSCAVARFDDANAASLSEAFVTAKSRGAIAAIGSVRDSYSNYNENISKKILNIALFTPNTLLGDAFLKAKRDVPDYYTAERYNNEKYVLLGEPVLNMPMQSIELELSNVPDTIQALEKLTISGNASIGMGLVRVQVLEGEKYRVLSQNLGNGTIHRDTIKVPGSPIYSEELQVKSGVFSTEFITPLKLSLGDTSAQIRLWGYKPGSAEIGRKAIYGIKLYGTSPDANLINDNNPPSIRIYPCQRSGIATPYAENAKVSLEIGSCLDVVIEDDTGIDYREEADEGISFEVSPVENRWHPWPFLEQTGKRAVVRMNFGASYEPGEYVFNVLAQDILGNTAFRSLRVSLSQEFNEGLSDVFNAPNPIKQKGTTFYFKDLSGDRRISSVRIKIFDQNGKLVKVMNNVRSGEPSAYWDGRDSRGRLLANGLYHYVVQSTVQSENGSRKTFEKKQKLVISR
jgi:Flagellar hook capping protein